jgi:hypothetical protein
MDTVKAVSRGLVTDGFDVVAVGVEDKSAVVVVVIARSQRRRDFLRSETAKPR